MVSNWRKTSFSKNIYCDICNICKGDLVRWKKLMSWSWVHYFILQTMKSLSQVFRKKQSLPKSKIISGFDKFPFFFQNFLRIPWIKNIWRINISTSDALVVIRFFHTYPSVGRQSKRLCEFNQIDMPNLCPKTSWDASTRFAPCVLRAGSVFFGKTSFQI